MNLSNASKFSVLSFHAGEVTETGLAMYCLDAGDVAVAITFFLLSKYCFSPVISNTAFPFNALNILLYESAFNGNDTLKYLASVETGSEHPLARAILEEKDAHLSDRLLRIKRDLMKRNRFAAIKAAASRIKEGSNEVEN